MADADSGGASAWPDPDVPRAARLLRDARRRARLTQEELAEASGLAVRTVRALESEPAGTPRRSSVWQICAALELEFADRDELLALYGLAPEPADVQFPYTRRHARPNALDAVTSDARARLEVVSVSTIASVGPRRTVLEEVEERVVTARVDGVDRSPAFWDPNPCPGTVGLDDLVVTGLFGCSVGAMTQVAVAGVFLFELVFPRPLRRGQSWSYAYRLRYRERAEQSRPGFGTASGFAGKIVTDKLDVITIGACFDAGQLPRECWQIFRHRPGDPAEDVRRLTVDNGESQLVIRNPRRGSHGVRWAW